MAVTERFIIYTVNLEVKLQTQSRLPAWLSTRLKFCMNYEESDEVIQSGQVTQSSVTVTDRITVGVCEIERSV